MKYLLDTDHITIIQQGQGDVYARLFARIRAHEADSVVTSMVSLHEQTLGAHSYINRARSQADVLRGYSQFARVLETYTTTKVLPFDAASLLVYEGLHARSTRVGTMDLRIAAIAMSRGMTLLTRIARDFGRIAGLKTEDWAA